MQVRVADYIANILVESKINTVFTVTGGGAMHLNDAFGHNPNIECVYNHHEQACSMAAEGYTRLSGRTAAVCVTSGPGGTNTLTGVMGAWLDSIPMIVISGQMKLITTIESTDLPLRQLGFQEFNIIDAVRCMTKFSVMIKDKSKIAYYIEKALYIAENGRPGPVWIDIPLDIQGEMIETDDVEHYVKNVETDLQPVSSNEIKFILSKINESKRPVLLLGNGIRIGRAEQLVEHVIEKLNIPVVTAWNAHDLIYDTHPLFAGRPGTIGTRGGNFVVQNSDLLISFGCRMNIRQISYEWSKFASNAYKIAIDIDENELYKPTLSIDHPIHADIKDVMSQILDSHEKVEKRHNDWILWCKEINRKYPVVLEKYKRMETPINPYVFMEGLSKRMNSNDIVVASNGTACVCSFQTIEIKKGQRMFTNAGASSMGWGLPAAVGAVISLKNRQQVICLEGDGSIQMNLQELQTVVYHNLKLKIFWLNNNGYHSIRQTQQLTFAGDKRGFCGVSDKSGISFPSAERIAWAYGIPYFCIDKLSNMDAQISKVLLENGPVICEVKLDENQFFEPKLSSKIHADGTITSPSLEDMYPFLPEEELKENMIAKS